jgi:hypothetical protein
MELTLSQAERFVKGSPRANWNGWDIEIFRADPNSFMRSQGTFYKGRWCLKTTVVPNSEGKYVITKGNAANASKSWD